MKKFLFILIFILLNSCRSENRSANKIASESNGESDILSMICVQSLQDSFQQFIDSVNVDNRGTVVYSLDIAKHKQDTIISFWASHYVLDDRNPFEDARFVYEIAKNNVLLRAYDWNGLYTSLVESPTKFTISGTAILDTNRIIAVTVRNISDISKLINVHCLDTTEFGPCRNLATYVDDRFPVIRIYKYNSNNLELLCTQGVNNELPHCADTKNDDKSAPHKSTSLQ